MRRMLEVDCLVQLEKNGVFQKRKRQVLKRADNGQGT